jgi:CheY-like chemotaxis protein
MSERRKRILTVEDAPNIRRLISYNLRRAGYDVLEAADGRAAVEVLQKAVPDLIILDVRMPELDGFQLLELMRRYPRAAAIPVIMLTALSQPADLDRALQLGVVDYLVKPLDPAVLLSTVARTLRAGEPVALSWTGPNRREYVRGTLFGVSFDPSPGGRGIDISEGGLSWRTRRPSAEGSIVVVEATDLFTTLAMPEPSLRARVCFVRAVADGEFRVGASFLGLTEGARDAIRRYILSLESRSALV